ncbi:MAG TPA: RNA 2',3'-cyclic phosphodiesterase [Bryobacteraceae bacterium]|jgi:2'-5' RNA ligase
MRLFVALDLPDTILKTLDALSRQLQPAARIGWSPVANLHITTKFIGNWPETRLAELKSALAAVPRAGAIRVQIEGLGWFPNPHSPRIFFAGIRAPHALADLAHATDAATARLGVPSEAREFHPHLTLARIKEPLDLAGLRKAVANLPSVAFGEFEARSQFLYSSRPAPSGSIYERLEEFPLS